MRCLATALILCLALASCGVSGEVLGLDYPSKIQNEYLWWMYTTTTTSKDMAAIKQWALTEVGVDVFEVLGIYIMGGTTAVHAHIEGSDESLNVVSEHADIQNFQVHQTTKLRGAIQSKLLEPEAGAEQVRATKTGFFQNNEVATNCLAEKTGSRLWGLTRIVSTDKPDYENAYYTWNTFYGSTVYAYVVDSGVQADHQELEGRVVSGFVAESLKGETTEDLNGHGTHVAGTIAGKTVGVAKSANIVPVKVVDKSGVGTVADIIASFEWVMNDINAKRAGDTVVNGVMNLAVGTEYPDAVLERVIYTVRDASLMVASVAAGNHGTDACLMSPGPTSTYAHVLVGATTAGDNLAAFSNVGSCVNLLAPGQRILSSYIGQSSPLAKMSGTSMAAAHVTGIMAKYLAHESIQVAPEDLQAWVLEQAQSDKINLEEASATTPNKMAYYEACEQPEPQHVFANKEEVWENELEKLLKMLQKS